MNMTLFLLVQVWSQTYYENETASWPALHTMCLSLVSISLKQASGGLGSEYKFEYIHPHAALLNLWA